MKEFIKKNKTKLIFVLIIIVAIFIRMFQWPMAISQVNCDEAMTAVNALAIAETGADTHGTSFPVYLEAWGMGGQSVALLYIMALFIKLFGFSFITVRLPMLVISIICLFVFYDLLKRIFKSEKIALIGLGLLAICPWHIMQSIWSIDCNMFPHFMLISVYLLYRGISDKKGFLYLSMFFFALTMYTYGVSVYVVPLFLLITAIYLLRIKRVRIRELLLCIFIYLGFSLPILTMYFLNFFKIDTDIHIGQMTIQYFENNTRSSDMLFFSENIWETLKGNIISLAKVIFVQYDALEWNAMPVLGTIYHISLIFFGIGLIGFIRKWRKDKKAEKNSSDMVSSEKLTSQEEVVIQNRKIGVCVIFIWLILSLVLGIIIKDVNINRLNVIWYPMIFFTVLGITQIMNKKKYILHMIYALYAIFFIGFAVYFYGYYTSEIDMSGCFSRTYIDAVHLAGEYAIETNGLPVLYFNEKGDGALDVYTQFQAEIDDISVECIKEVEEALDKIENLNQVFIVHKEYIKDNILFEKLDISEYFQVHFEDYVVLQKTR